MSFLDRFKRGKTSYSQCGDDVIIDFILECTEPGQKTGFYVDIGANHPVHLNNTYFFYNKNWTGINIDPIQANIDLFHKKRPRDTSICCGIGEKTEKRDFYIIDPPTLSTFDRKTAEQYASLGHRITKTEPVDFLSVEDLIDRHRIPDSIDLLTIDIEGDEYSILKKFLDRGTRPRIVVCETVHYSPDLRKAEKDRAKIDTICNLGYFLYADTFVNSLFVSTQFWRNDRA